MAEQSNDSELPAYFSSMAKNEDKIVAGLNTAQGEAVDLNGYYFAEQNLTSQAMRPSATLK